ncbi:hypothetical protein OS493_003444 [Desmophyllum pertusum]|uniref:Uncharacterized protein n=1 Tax=Desmophyllum pertusum TaxID=174260 RepID=A0A9X0A674_9CNID|nr:hypothetical protein OS493_003444 [Desmophyllum pertusum]
MSGTSTGSLLYEFHGLIAVTMPRCSRPRRMGPVLRRASSMDAPIITIAITLQIFLTSALLPVEHVKCDAVVIIYATKIKYNTRKNWGEGAFGVVYKATLKKRQGIEVFDTKKGPGAEQGQQGGCRQRIARYILFVNDFVVCMIDGQKFNVITRSHRRCRLSFSDCLKQLVAMSISDQCANVFHHLLILSDDPSEEQKRRIFV